MALRNPTHRPGLAALALAGLFAGPASAQALPEFDARHIVAISDGDFVADSYHRGRTAPAELAVRDTLSLIVPGTSPDGPKIQGVPAPNTVNGAPYPLAVDPEGRYAFVVEMRGSPGPDARLSAMPPGNTLRVFDLLAAGGPQEVGSQGLPPEPMTVDVSPDGRLLAITTRTRGAELVLVPVIGERLGEPVAFGLEALGIPPMPSYPGDGLRAGYATWHPDGRHLAVTLHTRNAVAFLELQGSVQEPKLRLWGNLVSVGTDPFSGHFTPDGRHFITSDWGRNFAASTLEGRLPQRNGTATVIRLASVDGADSTAFALHRVVHQAETGFSPEGIQISPDGAFVVTVNMRGSAFRTDSPRYSASSLTLLRFDGASGRLTRLSEYPFEGRLPENAAFDSDGDALLVTLFQTDTRETAPGGLELWHLVREPEDAALQRTGTVIELPRGVHHVVAVPE